MNRFFAQSFAQILGVGGASISRLNPNIFPFNTDRNIQNFIVSN